MSLQVSKAIIQKLKTKISFFSNFLEEEIVELLRVASHREYQPGDVIFKENSDGNEMYVILAGDVKISKLSGDGLDIVLAQLTSGDCFGEMSLIDGSKRSASAEAASDVNVMILKEDALQQNLSLAYKLFKNFSIMMANRLRITNKNYLETTADENKNRGRFSEVIKKYAERGGSFDNTNLRGSDFRQISFNNSSFEKTNLVHSKMQECRVTKSKLEKAIFVGAVFENSSFWECSFGGAIFDAALFEEVTFKNCIFQENAFRQLIARGVTIVNPTTSTT